MGPKESDTATLGGYPFRGTNGRPPELDDPVPRPPTPRRPGPPRGPGTLWPLLAGLLVLVLAGLGAAYALAHDGASRPASTGRTVVEVRTVPSRAAAKHAKQTSRAARTAPPVRVASTRPHVSRMVVVPGVVGFSRARAVSLLSSLGLHVRTEQVASSRPAGTVVAQDPGSGEKARRGTGVRLEISRGGTAARPRPGPVTVPYLEGRQLATALRLLRQQGLLPNLRRVPATAPAGTVVSQHPASGATLRRGDRVFLTVSKGRPAPTGIVVPDVTGLDEQTATTTLQAAGFSVDAQDQPTSDPSQDGVVIDEAPAGGARAASGSQVTITVGRYQSG